MVQKRSFGGQNRSQSWEFAASERFSITGQARRCTCASFNSLLPMWIDAVWLLTHYLMVMGSIGQGIESRIGAGNVIPVYLISTIHQKLFLIVKGSIAMFKYDLQLLQFVLKVYIHKYLYRFINGVCLHHRQHRRIHFTDCSWYIDD